jgi:hypothetical protein
MSLQVGKIYSLKAPGFGWVRVLPNPPRTVVTMDDGSPGYLVETLFTKNRWWVRGDGKPNNHRSPWLNVPNSPAVGKSE